MKGGSPDHIYLVGLNLAGEKQLTVTNEMFLKAIELLKLVSQQVRPVQLVFLFDRLCMTQW